MNNIIIRNAKPSEFCAVGNLMVEVYSQIEGFPSIEELPEYYSLLRNVGDLTNTPSIELLVALVNNKIAGAVVYFSNMNDCVTEGAAKLEKNASGFRLLTVSSNYRKLGIGKSMVFI